MTLYEPCCGSDNMIIAADMLINDYGINYRATALYCVKTSTSAAYILLVCYFRLQRYLQL